MVKKKKIKPPKRVGVEYTEEGNPGCKVKQHKKTISTKRSLNVYFLHLSPCRPGGQRSIHLRQLVASLTITTTTLQKRSIRRALRKRNFTCLKCPTGRDP